MSKNTLFTSLVHILTGIISMNECFENTQCAWFVTVLVQGSIFTLLPCLPQLERNWRQWLFPSQDRKPLSSQQFLPLQAQPTYKAPNDLCLFTSINIRIDFQTSLKIFLKCLFKPNPLNWLGLMLHTTSNTQFYDKRFASLILLHHFQYATCSHKQLFFFT